MKKAPVQEIDISEIDVFYKIRSSIGAMENHRYQQQIRGKIILTNEEEDTEILVGKILGEKLLMDSAAATGWGKFEVCDNEQHLMDIGQVIYDFENDDWNALLRDFYDEQIIEESVLVLSSIEILPEYRGLDIGRYVIKDLYNNFIQGAGLFVLKCFPLQKQIGTFDSTWHKQMKYSKMDKSYKRSFAKLFKYYEKMGFQNMPELSKEFMFINPIVKNKKFESIELD